MRLLDVSVHVGPLFLFSDSVHLNLTLCSVEVAGQVMIGLDERLSTLHNYWRLYLGLHLPSRGNHWSLLNNSWQWTYVDLPFRLDFKWQLSPIVLATSPLEVLLSPLVKALVEHVVDFNLLHIRFLPLVERILVLLFSVILFECLDRRFWRRWKFELCSSVCFPWTLVSLLTS